MKNLFLVLPTENISIMVKQIKIVANSVLGIVSVAAVFLSIYIGYRFMTADGDEKRREAKSQLIYAIIGVIVAVALTALMNSIDLASMLSTNPSTSTDSS